MSIKEAAQHVEATVSRVSPQLPVINANQDIFGVVRCAKAVE